MQPTVLISDDLQLPHGKIKKLSHNKYLKDIFLYPRKVTNKR